MTRETMTYHERVRQAIQLSSTGEPGMLYHEEGIDYSYMHVLQTVF